MRIALLDIAVAQKERLRRHLDAGAEFVEVPEAGAATPIEIDVVIASRFAAKEGGRARFRLLQVAGAGLDKIDFAAVPPAAWICNAFEHEQPIAEYAFAALLDQALGYRALTESIGAKGWGGAYFSRGPHGEVAGKTLGLIGLGHIGAAIARRAKAFDMTVMAVTGTRRNALPDNVDWVATDERLDEMLERVDFLVLACPLTPETRGMIGIDRLKRMKRTAFMVNVGRAEVAVEEDLFRALKEHLIAGAVLDTWYAYPSSAADADTQPSRYPFGSLPNVRMTPHSAAWTEGVWDRRCALFAANIGRLARGEPLVNVVRPPAQSA